MKIFLQKWESNVKQNFLVKICKFCIEIKLNMNQFKLLHLTLLIIEKWIL